MYLASNKRREAISLLKEYRVHLTDDMLRLLHELEEA